MNKYKIHFPNLIFLLLYIIYNIIYEKNVPPNCLLKDDLHSIDFEKHKKKRENELFWFYRN